MAELQFPTLVDAPEPWRWPAPPFAKWALHEMDGEAPEPCTVEALSGDTLDGLMVGFDPAAQQLRLRTRDGGPVLTLPFARFTRLTLLRACKLVDAETREPIERLPIAAQEQEYRLDRPPPLPPFAGHTLGHVEAAEGSYLYLARPADHDVQRLFVPRSVYERSLFGEPVEAAAARHWIATPAELLEAIATQHRRPVLPMGQALLALGIATPQQLLKAMAEPLGDMPLGERLVATGAITQGDLHTVIAHKLGYPVVDLSRFPIDPAIVSKLPMRTAFGCLAVPLMLEGRRLIVAVDRPSRVDDLREQQVLGDLVPVPVVAPRAHIKLRLMRLSRQREMWPGAVSRSPGFFPTTP